MSVAPLDYAPDVNPPEEFIGPPTDPEDERIEVGVVIVGGGPAGLACAIRLTQLLEGEPALAESLGEVPVALVEKGKTTGSHLLSGAMMEPSAMKKLFPDLRRVGVADVRHRREGHGLLHDQARCGAAEADPAAVPQPRQPRHLGRAARALPRREGRGGRRLHPPRDRRLQAAGRGRRGPRRPHGRQGPRPRRRAAAELRAGLGPDRQGHGAGRGHAGPPHRRRDPPLRPRLRGPAAVGARREGGLGGPEAARPRDPHDGLAAPLRRQVPRVRRQLHLPDGRGQGLARVRRGARLPGRHLLRPRRPPGVQDPPDDPQDPRGRQARGVGREDDPVRRLLRDARTGCGRPAW